MKVEKNATTELRVWCATCCIRIAPNEEKTIVRGKAYHPHCHLKIKTTGKDHCGAEMKDN